MSLTFDEVVNRLEAATARSQVAPVRITAHGEEGIVLYGYGGLLYEAPERGFLHASSADLMLTLADSYEFEDGRLTTESQLTNARVRLLNNFVSDTTTSDNWIPPTFQSFLVTRSEPASIQIGWASKRADRTNRRLILRVARGAGPQLTVVDIEMDQRGTFLTGLGALLAATTAVWTVSFLDPIPYAGNEIG